MVAFVSTQIPRWPMLPFLGDPRRPDDAPVTRDAAPPTSISLRAAMSLKRQSHRKTNGPNGRL